jgi:hypothetical protein
MMSWWNTAVSGNGAWAREARRLILAAGERHAAFDPEEVISFDVRDLQALTMGLRQRRRFSSTALVGNGTALEGRVG